MNVIDASDRTRLATLFRGESMPSPGLKAEVAKVVDDVRARGDAALFEHMRSENPAFEIAQVRVPIPMRPLPPRVCRR